MTLERAAAPLAMLRAQTTLELRLTLRRGESVLVTLIIPVLLLVFFSTVAVGGQPTLPGVAAARPLDALLPGILALAVMSTAMVSLGIATAFERQYGVLKRLGGSPLPRPVLLGAKILSVLALELAQVLLLVGVAAALGWRPVGGPLLFALAAVALLLGTAAFGGLGLWMAGSWRAEATLAGTNGLYLVLLLLGGIVVPAANLPAPLDAVAALLPSSALAGVLRFALNWTPGPHSVILDFTLLCLWAVFAPLLAARTFRWE
ncbi:MAG: ABC transporter permease [Chloroflexota bacterium]|nr:ABC transporter permease [Chloroflexota bacterium]